MAVDDIQNSENLLDLSKQILDSLNQRAASQQKLSSDEKAYATALEKSQKISNAIVSNQIKSKDLTKVIINAEENLNQIKQKFNNLEKTAQENRGKALVEARKSRQQERNTTQEIIDLTQQTYRLELDRQSLIQETNGLSFAQIQANQELASQLEAQIAGNREIISNKSTQLDLSRQYAQKEEAIAAIEKDKIKSGREVIRLKEQEIENLTTAYDLYKTNENVAKRIEASEKSREGTQDKLIDNQTKLNGLSNSFEQILQKTINSKTKFNELTQQNISFEKILSNTEKLAYNAKKTSLFELKKLYQDVRDLEKEKQAISNTPENQKALDNLNQQISLLKQEITSHEDIVASAKNIIKNNQIILLQNEDRLFELKEIIAEEKKYESLQKSIASTAKSRQDTLSKLTTFTQNQQDASQKLADITSKQIDDAEKLKELGKEKASFEKTFSSLEKEATKAREKAILGEKKSRQELRNLEQETQKISNRNIFLENIRQGLISAGKDDIAKSYEQEINNNNTLLKVKEDQANLLKTEIQEHSNINKASKDLIKNSSETLKNYKDQFQSLKDVVDKATKINDLTKDVTKSTDQQLQLQNDIQKKVDQQLTYKEKDKVLTQGITELQAKQDKAKQAADAFRFKSTSEYRKLHKSIIELDEKKLAVDKEIAKLNFEIYKLEQAKTSEQSKQNADSNIISSLQKKIDANNKLVASKAKENDLIDKELKTLNDSKSAAESLSNTVKSVNQTNLDKQKAITEELEKQTVTGDYGVQNSINLVKKLDDVNASIDKRRAIIGSVSTLESKIYNIATKQKDVSADIAANQQKYKNNQVDSKKISETIAAAEGTILANIKDIAGLEAELANRRQAAFSTIYSSRQKTKDLEQEIISLNQTQLALEGTRRGQLRLGNTDLADQIQQTIDLNKATIQNYQDEISKLGDVIKIREDLIISIGNTETSLKEIIEGHEKELVFLQKSLEARQKIEKVEADKAAKLKNQADNIAAIQNSENLLDLANDSLNSISERKKLLKGISAEEQLYAATVRQQQKVSQDITANAEKYLGYQIKSKELSKQIKSVEDNQAKSRAAFGNIENKLTEQKEKAVKEARKLRLQERSEVSKLQKLDEDTADLELKKQIALRKGEDDEAKRLQTRIKENQTNAKVIEKRITSLNKEVEKNKNIAKITADEIKNGKKILDAQAKELAFLKENEKIRKRIEKSTGLLGGMAKAASKIPGIGQYLNADEANEEMEKLAAEIEEGGGKATSFGNRMKIAGKGLQVLIKGAYENLKSPEAIFTFLLKSALTANDQAVKLGKSLGYAGGRADAYRETLVDIERSSNNLNVTTANLVEAFGELAKVTGFAYEFTADQLETQIKLTKQVGLTAEEAAQVQRFAVLNKKTSEETYRSFVRGLAVTRNQLRVGIDFKASLAEAVKVSGQLAANLGNNPETIAKAVVTAQALGMTLDQVAKSGESLLNFESSISNELQAELLTGKELNLERARAAALAGDQVALAEELSKNIGTAAEFTKMNRLQQNALAQAVGMTADELANTLRKREEALASGKSLVQISEEEAAQALERQSIQDKFNAAVLKLQSVIGNLVAGPLGSFLDMLSGALNIVNELGKALSFLATPLKVIASLYLGIKAAQLVINAGKAIELGLSAKQMVLEEGKFSLSKLQYILQGESYGARLAAYALSLKDIVVEKLKLIFSKSTYTSLLAQIARFPVLLGLKSTEAALATETAIASTATASAMSFGTAAVAIVAGIAAVAAAMYALKDGVIDPQTGPVISGEFGTVKLDKNDKAMYGADGKIKVGTDLLGTEGGIQSSVLKKSSAQASVANTNAQLLESINNLRQDTVRTNNEIKEATLASANKPAVISGKSAFVRDTFNEANKTAYKFA
jgi:hypothetical protein